MCVCSSLHVWTWSSGVSLCQVTLINRFLLHVVFILVVDYLSWLQLLCPTANGSQWSKRQLANVIPLRVRAVSALVSQLRDGQLLGLELTLTELADMGTFRLRWISGVYSLWKLVEFPAGSSRSLDFYTLRPVAAVSPLYLIFIKILRQFGVKTPSDKHLTITSY